MGLLRELEQKNLDGVIRELTENPTCIDDTTEKGVPLALYAAELGDFPIVKYIVEYSRASMNTMDEDHRTILHYAARSGNLELNRYLVEKVGMDITAGDRWCVTPYQIAYERKDEKLLSYYKERIGASYEEMYHNPIRRGMFPDPSIVRVGEDYYMVNSSFIFFPCIPISHSKDLIHWEIIGHAVTETEWASLDELEGGRGYWAPDISYHNGRFYVTATYRMNDTDGPRRRQIVVSSDRPEGPYSEPFYIEEDGIDPSLFHDDDGRSYMLLNRGARILELDLEKGRQLTPAVLLFYGDQKRAPEGPHLLKKDGWYYLFEAEGGTGEGHRITVSRSRTLMGIYEPCPYNPIMRQWLPDAPIQRCGHGKPVMTQHGDWYMVYLCGRMIDQKYSMLGRETALDPITWTTDGWPIVNHLQGPGCQQKKPLPEIPYYSKDKDTGFGANTLSGDFMTPRTPTLHGIQVQNGILTLEGSHADLNSADAKNVLVRRQEDFAFTAKVVMDCSALQDGQDAGMTCYYDENTYLKYGVYCIHSRYFLQVFEKINMDEHVAFSKDITDAIMTQMSEIELQITTDYLKRTFCYCCGKQETEPLGTLENVYYLCDEGIRKGKRFTGAMIGVYAYAAEECLKVNFRDFQYMSK